MCFLVVGYYWGDILKDKDKTFVNDDWRYQGEEIKMVALSSVECKYCYSG